MQWIHFVFDDNAPPNTLKLVYVCANYFTPDCFLKEGQFKAGFGKRFKLKDGSVATVPEEASLTQKIGAGYLKRHAPKRLTVNRAVFDKVKGCRLTWQLKTFNQSMLQIFHEDPKESYQPLYVNVKKNKNMTISSKTNNYNCLKMINYA